MSDYPDNWPGFPDSENLITTKRLEQVGSDWVHKDALKALEPALACCYEIVANGCDIDKILAAEALDKCWRLMRESITGSSDDLDSATHQETE